MKPFSNLVEILFGGAAEEIGRLWQDRLKVRRFKRRLKLYEEIAREINDSGIEPIAIPDHIWLPALSAASPIDDAGIRKLWATLLTNAANPEKQPNILPAFVEIINQLSPKEAIFLQQLYTDAHAGTTSEARRRLGDMSSLKGM